MARMLVVDDEAAICWGLSQLGRRLGHEVRVASSAEQAIEFARQGPADVVLLDVRLPGMDGLAAMEQLRELLGAAPIVVMTAHGDLSTAVEAVRQGAIEYLVKPFDLEQIERVLERALARHEPLESEPPRDVQLDGFVGRTPPMQEVFKRIALVSGSDACVFLHGESGSGKELAARAIHRYSSRAEGAFVAVNVAALSPTLAESELFGHVRGSFTGAEQPRAGLLVEADGGTLFLDEVGDIPLPVQIKLLRALEHGEVLPVGSGRAVKTNFRLISATHQDLPAKIKSGEFRLDLYYRITTFQIELPALAQRREDIPLLVEHFLQRFAGQNPAARLSSAALAEAQARPWHGNVRELRNAIEHALILARDGLILPEHLPAPAAPLRDLLGGEPGSPAPAIADSGATAAALPSLIEQWTAARLRAGDEPTMLYEEFLALVEPPLLEAALRRYRNQCSAAARALGLHRTTLRKKLDQYGIEGDA
jgi:two-component system nitrogen regulation response regulator GlnG